MTPVNGIDSFLEGLSLITKPGLRAYVVIPMTINILVLTLVLIYGVSQYDAWTTAITDSLPDWLSFLSGVFAFLAAVLVFVVVLFLFTIVANLVASPFNAILSEKVQERLTGSRPTTGHGLAVLMARSFAREFAKLLYYLPRLIGLLIITLIPGLNAAAPILWILFGAWMMCIQYADYAADNNGVGFTDMKERLAARRLQGTLFGLVVYAALAVPILNLALMPAAVAGGTVFWVTNRL